MKKTNQRYIALLIALTAIIGCKKSDSGGSPDATAKLLTSAPWKPTKIEWRATATGTWVTQTRGYSQMPTAAMTLFDNGVVTISGGGSGTWLLSGDKTQLTLIGSGGNATASIVTLDGSTLLLNTALSNVYTVDTSNGNYAITYYDTERDTYTH